MLRKLILMVLVAALGVLVTIQRAIGAAPDLVVNDLRYCTLYGDVAVVAAAFAQRVKSHAELKAGVDPIYVFQGQAVEISNRIVLIAWSMKPNPREWAIALIETCRGNNGDLRRFLAEPT